MSSICFTNQQELEIFSCSDLYSNCTCTSLLSLRRICSIVRCVHLHSRSDRLLLLLWSGSRSREHLQVVAAGKRLSNRHTSQDTNRVRKALREINTRAEMQDMLGVTDQQIEAVERALTIRSTTSLDQLFQDGDGSTLHELIEDDQNSNKLLLLDCDLAAEAIDKVLPMPIGLSHQAHNFYCCSPKH